MKKLGFPLTITGQLQLFPPIPDWAEDFFNAVEKERDRFREWFTWVDRVQNIEETRIFLEDAARFWQGGQRLIAIMVHERRIIGSVAFVRIDTQNKAGELGYWITEGMQGKGFVTLSLEKLIELGFQQLDLNRIEIRCNPANEKSIAMAARLGFTREGVLRQASLMRGRYEDVVVFSLLRKEKEAVSKDLRPFEPTNNIFKQPFSKREK